MSETVTPQTSKIDALTREAREALEQLPGSATKVSRHDLIAGFTNAVANIPDSMANAVLAGVNPVHGLYALVFGTPVAALTTSSKLMTVAVTGSMALVVADALAPIPPEARSTALLGLVLLVGIIQVMLGLLKAGSLVRFVSNSVMRGFLTGVAINIVLSQVPDVTGYQSDASNKVMRLIDVLLHPGGISLPTVGVALLTIGIILAAERTRIRSFAFPVALVVSTIIAYVAPIGVELVGDSAQLPSALPKFVLPQAGTFAGLLIPALSVAIVGLIQGAGISKSVPNPDGTYANLNRDFMGQGAGNLTSAFFGGMPVGGSLSSTAVNVQLGGRHRIANVVIAPVIATVLLLLAPAVELIPTATLGAMLVLIGSRAIDVPAIRAVWQTSVQTRTIMLITFVGTLIVPVQYAVIIGVALSIVQYTYRSSLDVRVVSLARDDQGRYVEGEAPESLPDDSITVLDVYGSVFYAGTDAIDRLLPNALGACNTVVVLRLRGRADVGSTFLELIKRYSAQLGEQGGYLALVGIGPALLDQLVRTGAADVIGREHIYMAEPALMASVDVAVTDAEAWLAAQERPDA